MDSNQLCGHQIKIQMNQSFSNFTCIILATFALATSCISVKKTTTTSVPDKQKSASVPPKETAPLPKESTTVKVAPVKPATPDNVIRETKKTEVYRPLPSAEAASAFQSSFPTAKSVVWIRENLLAQADVIQGYKVNFTIMDNKNTAIYTESGQLLEAKEQILPEQLPPNIYNAIKNKYPSGTIISATSVKYSVAKATYSAIIKEHPEADQMEIKLSETGEFVK